jgi:hypothetical protein
VTALPASILGSGNHAHSAKGFFDMTFMLTAKRLRSDALAQRFFVYSLLWDRGLGNARCVRLHRSVDEDRRRSKSGSSRLWGYFLGLGRRVRVSLLRSRRIRGRIRCLPAGGFGEELSLCSRC